MQDLTPAALQQILQNEQGAAIGSVVVRVDDPLTGNPLLTFAGDATFGYNLHWKSPLIAAWVDRVPGAINPDTVESLLPPDAPPIPSP